MFREMLQLSYLIVVANVTLLVFILFNSTLSVKRRNVFLTGGGIALLMTVCNIVEYSAAGEPDYLMLNKLCTALSYCISGPVMLPFVFLSNVIHVRVRNLLYGLAFINVILSVASIFTGWYFWFDENAVQHLGTLSPIPFGLSMLYLAMVLVASFYKFRLGMHGEGTFLTVLCVSVVAATLLNTVFHYRFLISGMAVLCCVFYYLFFTTQTLMRDALTDARNRHSFYKDLERMKRQQMIVISMDLNGLKQINDTLGHDAGDQAILAVADAMRECVPHKCRCYRMGGDEFEILYPNATLDEAKQMTERLKSSVAAKSYSVAIGYCPYSRGQDFEAVFREADAMMYEDKARMKQAMKS